MFSQLTYTEARELSIRLSHAILAAEQETIELARSRKETRDWLYGPDCLEMLQAVITELHQLANDAITEWQRKRSLVTA